MPPAPFTPTSAPWWKAATVYQVYPRSFNDSNGDGIGDLNGITEQARLPADLGVDVIWLSPHFDSPNADNGYDIRDYRRVMAEFGTMADFDRMLAGMQRAGHAADHRSGGQPHQRRARVVRREPSVDRQPLPRLLHLADRFRRWPAQQLSVVLSGSAWELGRARPGSTTCTTSPPSNPI